MVASEPVGPVDELPLYLPTEMEARSDLVVCTSAGNVEMRKYDFTQWLRGF